MRSPHRFTLYALLLLFSQTPGHVFSQLIPITVTGFNRDVIAEGTGSNPLTVTSTGFDGSTTTASIFYNVQFQLANSGVITGGGLPNNGTIVNGADTWQLQAYTGNNCLLFPAQTSSSSLSFTLTTPASYSEIALLSTAGSGPTSVSITLFFTNSTSTNYGTFSILDWFGGTPFVINNLGRIARQNPITGFSGLPGNPRFYQNTITLNAADQAKSLSKITITDMSTNNLSTAGFFAVGGIVYILPIGLNSLQGIWQPSQNDIQLQWQSAATEPGEHFEVQRSFNGTDFTGIAPIIPQPENLPQTFTYDDAAISGHSTWFYRILDVLPGGNAEYTDIIAVQTQTPSVGGIRLSASQSQLVIWGDLPTVPATSNPAADVTHYQLYAGSGQQLRGGTLSGSSNHALDISSLPQGVYFLRLSNGHQAQTFKFAKP
jgi:hypothetical protein